MKIFFVCDNFTKKWLEHINFTEKLSHQSHFKLSGNLKFVLKVSCHFLDEIFFLLEKKNSPQKMTFIIRIVCNNIKPNYLHCGL